MDESGNLIFNLFLIVFLLFSNGFFVAAEFAMVKVRKTRIEQLVKEGNFSAKIALEAIKDLDKLAVILEKKYFLYNSQKVSPLKKAGPNEFISWIYYSELTLISSFHGTAFSIIFHKPFIFFPNLDERDERVLSLLHQLGLEHCIYNGNLNTQNVPTINWELVDKILNLKRIESLNFLTSTLSH